LAGLVECLSIEFDGGDARSGGEQSERHHPAETAAGAGDNDNFTFEWSWHF
jgi:hypothetical protein